MDVVGGVGVLAVVLDSDRFHTQMDSKLSEKNQRGRIHLSVDDFVPIYLSVWTHFPISIFLITRPPFLRNSDTSDKLSENIYLSIETPIKL